MSIERVQDQVFARVAVQLRYMTSAQANLGIAEQARLERCGKPVRLPWILSNLGILSPQEAEQALEQIRLRTLFCTQCRGIFTRRPATPQGAATCPKCGQTAAPVPGAEDMTRENLLAGPAAASAQVLPPQGTLASRAAGRRPAAPASVTPPRAASTHSLALVIYRGNNTGSSFSLVNRVTLGRDPGSTIPLADGQSSRAHARIERRDDDFFLKDLGSENGTFVNGRRILRETPIRPGDIIRLGNTAFRVVEEGVPGLASTGEPATAVPVQPGPGDTDSHLPSVRLPPPLPVGPASGRTKIPGPADPSAAKWWIVYGERTEGPLSLEELEVLVADGEVTPQTILWADPMKTWAPASLVGGLALF